LHTLKLAEDITKDMIGDMFETRVGEIVCLKNWRLDITYPAYFTDARSRTTEGITYKSFSQTSPEDIVKHFSRSEYPEYYL